jgi:hypothetical protein
MTIKTLFAVIALSLVPALATAQCMGDKHKNTTASACGDQMVYDAATQSCVLKPTS